MPNLWVLSADAKSIVRASDITDIRMVPVPRGERHGHHLTVTTTAGVTIPMAEITRKGFAPDVPTTLAATIVEHSEKGGVIACMNWEDGDELGDQLFDYFTWPRALKEAGHVLEHPFA